MTQKYAGVLKLLKFPCCSVAEILSDVKPVGRIPNCKKPHVRKFKNFQIFQNSSHE